MIDLEAFANGFGLVVISLLLGIIIRAIVSAINAGSSRFHSFFGIMFLLLVFSKSELLAEERTGLIDSLNYNNSGLHFTVSDPYQFTTASPEEIEIIKNAFYQRSEITVSDLTTSPGTVETIMILDASNIQSKNISLLIGALSCSALALGLSIKL